MCACSVCLTERVSQSDGDVFTDLVRLHIMAASSNVLYNSSDY